MDDRQKILSSLIGIARAAEGNEGKLDGETDRLVCTALSAIAEEKIGSDAVDYILSALRKEKKRIAPDCFSCASPCGRTDDPDLSALSDSPEVSDLKERLVETLISLSCEKKINPSVYKALYLIGYDGLSRTDACQLLNGLESLL